MKWIAFVLAAFVLAAPCVFAADTPEEIILRYFDAFKAADFEAVANSMDESDMLKMKDNLLPVVEQTLVSDPMRVTREAAAMRAFLGTDGIDTLHEESPRAFFIRFMDWMSKQNPAAITTLAGSNIETLGHIMEGEVAHVVCRMHHDIRGMTMSELKVLSAVNTGIGWRMKLTGEIEGLSRMLNTGRPAPGR